jgi:hypothetical protein
MRVLELNGFSAGKFKEKYKCLLAHLEKGDFRAAQVKKLANHSIYRAKLDDSARLLFKIVAYGNEKVLLVLELLPNHEYHKSRFLRGASVEESDFEVVNELAPNTATEKIKYLNPQTPKFHYLHTPLSFDNHQNELLAFNPPMVIIGSAGCGKTVLTLEKLKELTGQVLYVTLSPYLAEHSRNIYFSSGFESESQDIEFLSFRDLIETIKIPDGRELTYQHFAPWFHRIKQNYGLKDAHKVYEEIRGVITGSSLENGYLSRSEYEKLGVRQSIFTEADRGRIYSLFERCLEFQKEQKLYDPSVVAFEYAKFAEKKYDFVVIDEVQDLTLPQLKLILGSAKNPANFIMCGDSNQIVHPNFFSWANIRRLFYQDSTVQDQREVIHILHTNYRNAKRVTELSNKLLLLKQKRFGSTDRESNFLMDSCSEEQGAVEVLETNDKMRKDIDAKIRRSTRYAVVVLRDEDKAQAQQWFSTPLIFSIHEAKGLEYENIVLCNIISSCEKEFREIVGDIQAHDLAGELNYARAKSKEDKSLEEYKFFINSLYVALTRATDRVYLLESKTEHPLLKVLGLKSTQSAPDIKNQESSREDWQREARRLEMQGKTEQANQIRSRILGSKPVPWNVLNSENFQAVKAKALSTKVIDKKSQHLLFEYALQYGADYHLTPLVNAKYTYAREPEKNLNYVFNKLYGSFLGTSGTQPWKSLVEQYGIDFRNPLNETPLMMAVKSGNDAAVRELIDLGSKVLDRDSVGMNAFQKGLRQLLMPANSSADQQKVAQCTSLVGPSAIKIKVQDKMYKLDAKSMEYFILQAIFSVFPKLIAEQGQESRIPSIKASMLEDYLQKIPDFILPPHRKRRSYINAMLAKNEVDSNQPYNRHLFARLRVGFYLFNPQLELEVGDEWVNIYDLMKLELFDGRLGPNMTSWLRNTLKLFGPGNSLQNTKTPMRDTPPNIRRDPPVAAKQPQSIADQLFGRQ